MILSHLPVVLAIMFPVLAQDRVIYPDNYDTQEVATKISCKVMEPQHFVYSSNTQLWGMMGGEISITAQVTLLCLGDDRGGIYGPEALKYKVEIENLQIREVNERDHHAMLREKRGAREFISNQWGKIKQFFKRVFGRGSEGCSPPDSPRATDAEEDGNSREDVELLESFDSAAFLSLYSAPFQFIQMANGSIPELRFTENEVDTRVKNFKRHLVDAFSTQLDSGNRRKPIVEKSVIGEHTSAYNITVSGKTANLNFDEFEEMGLEKEKPMVIVQKVVTEADILKLAPSEAVNDRDKMDLKVEQVQVFQDGRMISSSGTHSLTLLPDSDKKSSNRIRREDGFDFTSFMQSQTTFEIQLQKRHRRSTARSIPTDHQETNSYLPASRVAEFEGNSRRDRRRMLPESSVEVKKMFQNLTTVKDEEYDDKLQALLELVEGEISMGLDKENNSVSVAAKEYFSLETMHSLCRREFSICKDFLQLLALIGGSEVEDVFLSFLSMENSSNIMEILIIADLVSDVSRPSDNFLHSLSDLVKNDSMTQECLGTLCISLGHLTSSSSAENISNVSRIFLDLLKTNLVNCEVDTFVVDILEAIGNLKSSICVSDVLEMSRLCAENKIIQTASIHALRHSTHLDNVQQWIQELLTSSDCDILREVVGALLDKIQDQSLSPEDIQWPRSGFNAIDQLLKNHLSISGCSFEDILRYFQRKRNQEANDIAQTHFSPGSEPLDSQSVGRQKRAAWDDLNCHSWSDDDRFFSIQDREEFASDRATYNNRRSCLGYKKLGIKGANAEIYAGMFAGVKEPSEPPKYKLFTKFVSQLNFLGEQMEIGSFRFYHMNGKMNTYVKILGRTRQEFSHEGCTPTDLVYRPLRHLPLFLVNVGIAQLSLGVQVSTQLGMKTLCPSTDVYQLQPLASVRVGGEATGTVLFIRGGINMGGNFNYNLKFTLTPSPNMCLKGTHGFDPMNIGFETYYQLWNKVKDDWGKTRTWRPGFVTWNLTRGGDQPWFDDTCIVKTRSAKNSEREIE